MLRWNPVWPPKISCVCVELSLTAGCWIKFARIWQQWFDSVITTVCFITVLISRYNDWLFPLLNTAFFLLVSNPWLIYNSRIPAGYGCLRKMVHSRSLFSRVIPVYQGKYNCLVQFSYNSNYMYRDSPPLHLSCFYSVNIIIIKHVLYDRNSNVGNREGKLAVMSLLCNSPLTCHFCMNFNVVSFRNATTTLLENALFPDCYD